MEVKPNRTPSYVFTADLSKPEDLEAIIELRGLIRGRNRNSGADEQTRVELKGRLGKNNPKAEGYRARYRGIGFMSPYSRIRLEDAQFADVYVLPRHS